MAGKSNIFPPLPFSKLFCENPKIAEVVKYMLNNVDNVDDHDHDDDDDDDNLLEEKLLFKVICENCIYFPEK